MFPLGERRRLIQSHRRFRKSGRGGAESDDENESPFLSHRRDDRMSLLRRRRSAGGGGGGALFGTTGITIKKNRHFSASLARLRRRGDCGGGGGPEDDCCHSDASSSAPDLAYLYDDPPSPSTPSSTPGDDGNCCAAEEEAEAAVLRGKVRGDDDNWTEASAAAAASVAALAEAVRRGSEEMGVGSRGECRLRELISPLISPHCSPRSEGEEVGMDMDMDMELPAPPSGEDDGSEECGEIRGSDDSIMIPNLQTTAQEALRDAPTLVEEGGTSSNGRFHEEEKKEEENFPPPPPPPVLLPPNPSMPSPQRRKYAAANLPGGGVTFADDHSSISAPLEDVRKVSPLPKDCYGGCHRGQHRGEGAPISSKKVVGRLSLDDVSMDGRDGASPGPAHPPVIVLLLCPSTRQFELVRVSLSSSSPEGRRGGDSAAASSSLPTCGDVLSRARRKATFRPVRKQRYTGLCQMPTPTASSRQSGEGIGAAGADKAEVAREMINALRIDMYGIGETGEGGRNVCDGGVLVAIPKGLTASKAAELAGPILSDETMRRLMRERLSLRKKRRRGARHRRGGSNEREGNRTMIEEKASRIVAALKAMLLAALALVILSTAAFALFPTRVQLILDVTVVWMRPLLSRVFVPRPAPAPTPGYRDDNMGVLEECCRQDDEAGTGATAGGDGPWLSFK